MEKIFLEGAEWNFVVEIIGRTAVMFVVILFVLRLSGRRGVRQLTLFEIAIILGMGSAAGDPMFQEDIPVVYGVVVLLITISIYKIMTWLASHSMIVHRLLEGTAKVVVRDGVFDVEHEKDNDFSKMEFFAELRNQSVEHLGQVRLALLESDGTMSILYYTDEQVQYGLPLFPPDYREIDPYTASGPIACMYCGTVAKAPLMVRECPKCKNKKWAIAINSLRLK